MSEQNINSTKIFSTRAVIAGSFLGGPLAGGYLLFHNYKTVGDEKMSRNIVIGSLIFSLAVILFLFLIDGVKIEVPGFVIPLLYTMAFVQISKLFFQKHGAKIEKEIIALKPWYSTLAVSVLGLLVFVIMYVVIYFLIPLPYFCRDLEGTRNGGVYDQFEASCMIYTGLDKSIPLEEVDTVLSLEQDYLEKEGLVSQEQRTTQMDKVIDPQPYILENYVGPLTSSQITQVLDFELNYLKYIGVVDEEKAN